MNYRLLVAGVFWHEYSYISKRVKVGPPTNPATRLREKFLSLMRYNLFGVFPFRWIPFCRIPFRRMPCKLFFPSFSFLIPFINAIQPFYGCQQNARKNITVTVSVRVSVMVRVSLVWCHRHFLFRKKVHGFLANLDAAKWDSAKRDSAKWGITTFLWVSTKCA